MTIRTALVSCVAIALSGPAFAADVSGVISLGGRDVDVSGSENKYLEDVNLDDGARLFNLAVTVRPDSADDLAPDLIDLDARNLGGDPHESLRLSIRKYGAYALSVQRRRSDWFYDDIIVLPEDASVAGSTGGDFHRFDVERVRDDVALRIHLNERTNVNLGFNRYAKSGDSTTTLDISRDEFELDKPVDELLKSWRLGLDYRWRNTRLSLEQRIHDYANNTELFLPGFSVGENPDDLTTLDFYFLDTPYEYSSKEYLARLTSRLNERLQVSVLTLLGNLDLDTRVDERAQGSDFMGLPLATSDGGSGAIERDTTVLDWSLRYALTDRLSLAARFRQRDLEQSGAVDFSAVEGGRGQWDIERRSFDLGLSWQAADTLLLSAGWQSDRRNIDRSSEQSGGSPNALSEKSDAEGLFVIVDYRPNERLRFNARYNDNSHDDPYSLAAPSDVTRYRLRANYRSAGGLQVTASHARKDRDNDLGRWAASTRQSTLRVSRALANVTLSVGATRARNSQRYQRLVSGGSRQDLFDVAYRADTDYLDAAVRWRVDERWSVGGYWRTYANDGSFAVDRDDWRAFFDVELPRNYSLTVSYRDIFYQEGGLERFDARILEFAVKLRL